MRYRQFIELFIPPICYKAKKYLFPKPEREWNPLPKFSREGDKVIIVGNGPSLNKTMELYDDILRKAPCMMVNFAANTELYERIKPSIYLLVDPAWYNPTEKLQTIVESCIDAIVCKTVWPMTIVMPNRAKESHAVQRFKENANLRILFYEDGWQLPKGMSKFEAWDKNLIYPPAQTVLNTAVWLSIYWGYKETYLVGADTSWHAELKMDQETNELYTIDTHFYGNKAVYGELYDEKQNRRPIGTKLHEELFAEATALKEYCELREYAEWKGVKVYNASEYSWIDAFERKKLKQC